ncbi:MAG TPA: hypothetical protein PLM62_04530, partial [Zoogloea sp.]|nr:hypothetical protein [Zoogloea sp.]
VSKALKDVGETLGLNINTGMAWVYEKYANEPAYFAAERAAKSGRAVTSTPAKPPALGRTSSGRCGEKRFCKEIATSEEARYCGGSPNTQCPRVVTMAAITPTTTETTK